MDTKLIILRGPSGSGKSTIANILPQRSKYKFATVEQDMFRQTILHNQLGARELSATLCKNSIIECLESGFSVIAEGIFNAKNYKQIFDAIIKNHPNNNYAYYFDVSFEETIRRHKTRDKKHQFNSEDMKPWYKSASPLGYDFESVINENHSIEDSINKIIQETGI